MFHGARNPSVFLGVAKKVHKLTEGAELAVWGLASTLPPYVLAALLNQNLNWNLARSRQDVEWALEPQGEISAFQLFFQDLELHGLPLCMVSNRGSLGLLLPWVGGMDYILTWPAEALELWGTDDPRLRLASIAGVDLVADLRTVLSPKALEPLRFDPLDRHHSDSDLH